MKRDILNLGTLLWILILCVPGRPLLAQAPTAVASLSQREAAVGDEVELTIKLRGASQLRWQGSLNVDGLEIRGPRMQSALGFGGLGALGEGMTLTFAVTPMREGRFTIPPIEMSADGKAVRTQPVDLLVRAGLKAQDPAKPADAAHGIIEIVIPKKTVFVGEMVPVEIRLAVDSRVRWQPEAMPEITGEGFTRQKLPEPKQEHVTKDGREMDVLVFRTAITPSKAGRITLGPVEIPYIAQVPRAKRNNNRARSLFDMFDDSVFGDPFFAVNQRYRARAEAVELEVKPLPTAGRPASFSGAVGRFKFEASGSPAQVKVGDPVTMKLSISGRGNFDRIQAPALADSTGWRGYPPSADFKSDDDLNTSGTKTFTMAVIPETKQSAMPVFEFSYFDPDAEKYVALKSEPMALTVTGSAPPRPVPAEPAPDAAKPSSTASAPAPAPPADILGIRYDSGGGRRSFEPLHRQRPFLLAQLLPLAVLAGWLFLRLRKTDEHGRVVAAWRREKVATVARLRGRELSDQDFLDAAAHAIQLETAIVTGRPAGSVDAAFAIASRRLDDATAEGVERLFNARAELLYAGMKGGRDRLSAEERSALRDLVARFERSEVRA